MSAARSLCARRGLLAAAGLVLAAAAAPAAAAVRPVYGGELRVALPAPARVLDPARARDPQDLLAVRALDAPLLEVDAAGSLAPGLLAEVPAPDPGGRAFHLRLRPDARFSDGAPVTAQDVATALARLLQPGVASPHAWIALPIAGADAVLAGRALSPAGVAVRSERELTVTLAFPLPDFPWALAAPAASPRSAAGAGAGPFRTAGPAAPGGALRLVANPHDPRGRPFADALVLAPEGARAAADALARRGLALAIRPEALGPGAVELPALVATYAVVNGGRLGARAAPLRAALDALDRAELVRRFVRGPAAPLDALVPPAPGAARPAARRPAPPAGGAPPDRVTLLVADAAPDQRAVADRLQVKLFDRGVRAGVERVPADRLAERVARGDYDVALVPVTLATPRPALAAAEVAFAAGGPRLARRALEALAGVSAEALPAALDRLAREAGIVPLFTTGLWATPGPALRGLAPRPGGAIDAGGLWLLEPEATP